jgi:spermidine synthase
MSSRTRLVSLLLFGSGFCALIYQTTWLREFRLIFGGSTAASAAVLGVFMAGLGFGGIVLGRRAENKAKPLAFYGQLEVLIAISAACSPLLIWGSRYLYIAAGGTQAIGMTAGTIVRLLIAAIILAIPTFLMGGTLPAAARASVSPEDTSRRSIGLLYGLNTLGAVTGAVAATFFLLETFGNRLTLWLAAALNLAIALIALRLSKSTPEPQPTAKPRKNEKPEPQTETKANPTFAFAAAWLVGFAFFLMELVWYRMLGPLLGGSTFSFGLILGMALLGIGLGGAAYSLFGLRRTASLQFFALTCAAEAFFIALPYAMGDRIALGALLLRPLGTFGFYGHILAWSALAALVILPAAFVSGVQFPLLIALLGKGRKNVATQTGTAYAWNTMGALIGSLAGGFGLLPLFSAPGVWKLVIVLLSILAIWATLLALREPFHWFRSLSPVLLVALACLMLGATGPTAFWRHSQIGVGRVKQFQASPNEVRDLINRMRRQIAWEKDGQESSVALAKTDSLAFIVNGKSDGNAKYDAGTQIMSGLIGAALHPRPKKSMVVGLGTGCTAGWLAAVPEMERVDAIELEPTVLKVAEACAAVNQKALTNPKLRITIGDAREVLLTTREKYDIVVSEPSNPYRAGVAGLFTTEYYRSVDRCLAADGMFFQWVQAYDIDDRTMQTFYSTLGSVFSNIESWQTERGDLLLLASHKPIVYDVAALRARLAEEPFKSALLAAWRGNSLEDFLSHFVGNNALARSFAQAHRGPLNTDDRTVIEFAFARSVDIISGFRLSHLRAASRAAGLDRPEVVQGDVDWSRIDESRLAMYFTSLSDAAEAAGHKLSVDAQNRVAALDSYGRGDLPGALRNWRRQSQEPVTLSELTMVAECLAAEGDPAALSYIEKLGAILPWDAEAIRAEFYWRDRRPQEATETLEKFFLGLRDDPWCARDVIRRSMTRAEGLANSDRSRTAGAILYRALQQPLSTFNNEKERIATLLALGVYLDGDRPGEYTAQALKNFEPHVLWIRKFLEVRKNCYTALNHPLAPQAIRDLREFQEHQASLADVSSAAKDVETRSGVSPGTDASLREDSDFR